MAVIPTRREMHDALAQRHGAAMQARLEQARVAICGLGGLGSNIAIALARAGVGHLHLLDFDRVDLSNLNRQQYAVGQLGLAKTDAMRQNIARIAPYCEVKTTTVRLAAENIPRLLAEEEILCEAFDKAEEKAMLVNTALETMPSKWLVAASGMGGLASANLIRTRRISRRFLLCGDGTSGIETGEGLFAARVQLCAAHQALAVIRIIAGELDDPRADS